ncbi:MAG: PstS family phosphate ABC transporter substrate-binding protein [Planctomycetales bacterium]|nr:PstS family phosphate ABC transporter substrate-binding protein [Planctomycetales bacterium]
MLKQIWLGVLAAATLAAPAWAQVTVDSNLPDYKPVPGVSGTIKSVGSDTMNNLMTLWAEGFQKYYPNVKVEIEGKGSSTAPPALIEGTATFGPMSRAMKPAEIDAFSSKFGYKPVQLGTSIDMLAVYVNKDNPLKGLTLPQVDAIFSSTRKQGHPDDIRTWGQLGLDGDWKNAPISLYGRNSASGTYGFFKEKVLSEGDYKTSVKEQPGSSTVVQGVAKEKFGMGYSGIGYKTADVNAIALAKDENSEMVDPTADNAYTGKYPLARFLLLSVNYKPGSDLDPLRREFLKFIYSKQGQTEVVKDGYFPVQAPIAKRMLSQVGIEN